MIKLFNARSLPVQSLQFMRSLVNFYFKILDWWFHPRVARGCCRPMPKRCHPASRLWKSTVRLQGSQHCSGCSVVQAVRNCWKYHRLVARNCSLPRPKPIHVLGAEFDRRYERSCLNPLLQKQEGFVGGALAPKLLKFKRQFVVA